MRACDRNNVRLLMAFFPGRWINIVQAEKKYNYVSAGPGETKKSHPVGRVCFFLAIKPILLTGIFSARWRDSAIKKKKQRCLTHHQKNKGQTESKHNFRRNEILSMLQNKKWDVTFGVRPGGRKKNLTRPVRRKHMYFFFSALRLSKSCLFEKYIVVR